MTYDGRLSDQSYYVPVMTYDGRLSDQSYYVPVMTYDGRLSDQRDTRAYYTGYNCQL